MRDYGSLVGRSSRKKTRRFLAEGPQAVREALSHPDASGIIIEALITADAADRNADLIDRADAAGVRLRQISPVALAQITDTVSSQGVVAICAQLDASLTDVLAARPRLVAVASQIRDPGNAGTLIRSADAAGADAVVFTSSSVDHYNPKVVRSTAGSIFHLPVVGGLTLAEIIAELKAAGLAVLAADGNPPALDLHELPEGGTDLRVPHAWIFGNEAWGLPAEDRDLADAVVAVPLYGRAESLNVGTAASVCLFESARAQRQ